MEDKLAIFNSTAFTSINHIERMLNNLRALHKLSCPQAYEVGADYFQKKRDLSLHANIQQYWHNKLKDLFIDASHLLDSYSIEDEAYFKLTRYDILTILKDVRSKYEIFTYKLK